MHDVQRCRVRQCPECQVFWDEWFVALRDHMESVTRAGERAIVHAE